MKPQDRKLLKQNNEFSSIGRIKRALTVARLADVGCELSRFDVIELIGFIYDMEQIYSENQARIAELEQAQRWIPVSERLPEVKEDCLFLCFIDGVSRRFVDARTWFADAKMFTSSNVTHWMPLPVPPEGDA